VHYHRIYLDTTAKDMSVKLGDVVPNFCAETTNGSIDFHEWIGSSYAILFSHPADYTPVCTTELGVVAKIFSSFQQRGVKVKRQICVVCNEMMFFRHSLSINMRSGRCVVMQWSGVPQRVD
jgi:peroxiredoxin